MDTLNFQKELDKPTDLGWQPACGGTENPFVYEGQEYIYMWNRSKGEHAYYNISDDVFEERGKFE